MFVIFLYAGSKIWRLFHILSNICARLVCLWSELYTDADWIHCAWYAKQKNRTPRATASGQFEIYAQSLMEWCVKRR